MVIMPDEGQQRVEIVNDQSGERYGVTVDAYRELYERRGFRIDRFEDGRPYADVDEAIVAEAPAEAPAEAAPSAPADPAPGEAA